MSFTIIFCADGNLRVKHEQADLLIPLIEFQNDSKQDNFHFMIDWWNKNVIFEKGLTIGTFLECLKPWQDFWKAITKKDVEAYIIQSKKPAKIREDRDLWYATISYLSEATPDADFGEYFKDEHTYLDTSSETELNPKMLPFWNFENYYKLSGHKLGEEKNYCLDYTPIHELAHIPLILNHYQTILVCDSLLKSYGNKEQSLLNQNAIGLRSVTATLAGETFTNQYILGDKWHKFKDIVEAFFLWFSTEPAKHNTIGNNLDIQEQIDNYIETQELLNNEESLNIYPDMLDSIYDKDEIYFKKVLESSKKTANTPLKIGKLIEQPLPEKRVLSWLVNDEDIHLSRPVR